MYGPSTKKIVFAVTNDLSNDQRMMRICNTLQKNGYQVLLVGRKKNNSEELNDKEYKQKRLYCFINKGKWFYIEYNLRLFFYLLFIKMDIICSIDLDTILPCYYVSKLRDKKRVFDAHELFCEMKEVISRKKIHAFWKNIEKHYLPLFKNGYTVSQPISDLFHKDYGLDYTVIMNVPFQTEKKSVEKKQFIIYQGSVNEGRSLETIIPAFKYVSLPLYIYGSGNYFEQCKDLVSRHQLQNKVFLMGPVSPAQLIQITPTAILGLNLLEPTGLNNYYSLANRFFDYMHAGIPQVCIDFPSYREINNQFEIAILTNKLTPEAIAETINTLLNNETLMNQLSENCFEAAKHYNWQIEEKKILAFYETLLA